MAFATSSAPNGAEQVVVGNAGDHLLVQELLRAVGQAHSPDDYNSWLDEPSYEPPDRLIIRQQSRVIGHVHLLFRNAWFDSIKLPAAGLIDLAVLPEYQPSGLELRLLVAAEQAMHDEGTVVSLIRTNRPEVLARAGWTIASSQGYSQANSRDILSHLTAQAGICRRGRDQFNVRLWRHFELESLMPVYQQSARTQWGPLARNEHYWQWLLTRKAHDKVIVAIDGHDPCHLVAPAESTGEQIAEPATTGHVAPPKIVAYAVLQGSRVVEMQCLPGFEVAGLQVLARACRDAIEQDHHTISLHAAANDPMHEILVTAGGSWNAGGDSGDGLLMVKLLDPERWIEALYPVLHARAKASGVERPCEIQFEVGHQPCRLRLTRRSSRLERGGTAPADVRCDRDTFDALVLGDANVGRLRQAGRLTILRPEVIPQLAALFPAQCLWQSPFDLLRF